MMTGRGFVFMIFRTVVNPFIRGISMSSVTTSGCRVLIFVRASSPFRAVPITEICESDCSKSTRTFCISSESSTTRILICFANLHHVYT